MIDSSVFTLCLISAALVFRVVWQRSHERTDVRVSAALGRDRDAEVRGVGTTVADGVGDTGPGNVSAMLRSGACVAAKVGSWSDWWVTPEVGVAGSVCD